MSGTIPPYKIVSVVDDQAEQPDGTLQNQFDVTFTVPALNNYTSSISVPKAGKNTVANVSAAVEEAIREVAAVYALGV